VLSYLRIYDLPFTAHKCIDIIQYNTVLAIQRFYVMLYGCGLFQVCEVSATALVREELAERFKTIVDRLHNLKLENDEVRRQRSSSKFLLLGWTVSCWPMYINAL